MRQSFRIRTHVALLRGINVGGHNRVAMADLRGVAAALGYGEVETYIQSGNLVFAYDSADPQRLAAELERAIAGALGVRPRVVVLSAAELAAVVALNPFPDESEPKRLHAGFRADDISPAEIVAIDTARAVARAKGSRDEVDVVGRTLYLRTPDGLGRSELAVQLGRAGGPLRAAATTTMRNWATVSKLAALLPVDP